MFGCGQYPTHDEFVESVKIEAEQAVRRLRHHTSLVIFVRPSLHRSWRAQERVAADARPSTPRPATTRTTRSPSSSRSSSTTRTRRPTSARPTFPRGTSTSARQVSGRYGPLQSRPLLTRDLPNAAARGRRAPVRRLLPPRLAVLGLRQGNDGPRARRPAPGPSPAPPLAASSHGAPDASLTQALCRPSGTCGTARRSTGRSGPTSRAASSPSSAWRVRPAPLLSRR